MWFCKKATSYLLPTIKDASWQLLPFFVYLLLMQFEWSKLLFHQWKTSCIDVINNKARSFVSMQNTIRWRSDQFSYTCCRSWRKNYLNPPHTGTFYAHYFKDQTYKGGFHLHLFVFPFVYQFNSRIGVLVKSSFAND